MEKKLLYSFFIVTIIEITAEYFRILPLIYVFKPLISIILMLFYWFSSVKKNPLFFVIITTSMITNIFFIPKDIEYLYIGLLVFIFHRILMIYLLLKVTRINQSLPIILATLPFLFIFIFIFVSSDLIPEKVYTIMIIHNILISILGGIALASYVLDDNFKNSWLLICVLLFVTLHFIIFIEKFFIGLQFFRPIAMSLNAFGYFTFCRYILITEKNMQSNVADKLI